ncbi:MAG: glutathione S-transferase family protein [Rhizobiales bacterium]|nr:glutathione S-transferase family protein [Hyphomicrobiales bacterium]
MALILHMHPLASFCHKVLIALYENETPFEAKIVDFGAPEDRDSLTAMWPAGKIPVLQDKARNRAIPETTIIIEYLEQHYPGKRPLLPKDETERLNVRLWDRFYDQYVHQPMQRIVADRIRPQDVRDPYGVAEARETLKTAYGMIDKQAASNRWAAGDAFTMADCAACPALFYAGIIEPFGDAHPVTAAYFERLYERNSVRRVLEEAKPYFGMFPYRELMPQRFA